MEALASGLEAALDSGQFKVGTAQLEELECGAGQVPRRRLGSRP